MPMSDEDKEEIRKEIAEAQRILREDHIIVSQKQILDKLHKHFPEDDSDDGTPKPPDKKEDPNEPPKPKKSAWWGDALESPSGD